ncbi:phosphopentomutase [Buchnera aphidicola (Kurisakia onigurumii)]|uniref:phosphopentomutase n=1 Tax=Buchnera aphidicola TaxID=9 RepID=UPI0031B730EA
MKKVIILILDSFGIGSTEDSYKFSDHGSNTFGHISQFCHMQYLYGKRNKLHIPNLISLGLGLSYKYIHSEFPTGINNCNKNIIGSYGYASEISSGKDTISGHWEIAGVPVLFNWDYFKSTENSFPKVLLEKILFSAKIKGILGNCHSSGTEILEYLGEKHIKTKYPIFYTSSDSVFQIACHEHIFGLKNLYELCYLVRKILDENNYKIARVIARPFIGYEKRNFIRTNNRKDFSIPPSDITVMEKLITERQGSVISVGKIFDIYSGVGITKKIQAYGSKNLFSSTISAIKSCNKDSIILTNFVDFDSVWGHRRDVLGYANELEKFDEMLPNLLKLITKQDLLIITADHGCDPTWIGTDHTREYIPILIYKKNNLPIFIGHRKTFADISQTIAKYFCLSKMNYGKEIII